MAKEKTIFICSNCNEKHLKWQGQCFNCSTWNTLEEKVEISSKTTKSFVESQDKYLNSLKKPILLSDIEAGNTVRVRLPGKELNRVLGGGLVPGSLILLGGQPGIGKSTLMLQTALRFNKKCLYVTGEESAEQVRLRADRISSNPSKCYIFTATNIQQIINNATNFKPSFLIVDSIQTVYSDQVDSSPGSVSQIRECAYELQQFAKAYNIPVFIIGHITKDGSLAGPKILEHTVDVVLQFEGDRHYSFRLVRSIKNRFGSTDELGIYEMQGTGLREIHNPSELLIAQEDSSLSGCAIGATMEGQRCLMVEGQALVSMAAYGTPQRSSTGFDNRRASMLLAVLEKRCGYALGTKDVFINIAGGFKVLDPGIDLAILVAIISSFEDISIPSTACFCGEIGLTGEIRPVSRLLARIQEAQRIGFKSIFVPASGFQKISNDFAIHVVPIKNIQELHGKLFEQ